MVISCCACLQPSDFDFEMQHGVMRVWRNSSRDECVADTPGDSHEFFVDMHRWGRKRVIASVVTDPAAVTG